VKKSNTHTYNTLKVWRCPYSLPPLIQTSPSFASAEPLVPTDLQDVVLHSEDK